MNKADIYIKDNGIGIPPSDLKRVFKRFYRVLASRRRPKGTGLGLAIVRAIIVRHGGRVGAESKGEGKGSTFWVQLPRSLMKILIVEDERHLADGLRFNLEAEGYEAVDRRQTARRRSTSLAKQQFDAIVLDIMLPGIDGFEVAQTASREREDFTPILMLTARSRPEDVLDGFEAGTDDYLPKPFDLNIFFARLNGLLRRRNWFEQQSKTNASSERSPSTAARSISQISSCVTARTRSSASR